jgi:alanine dehydrogenase
MRIGIPRELKPREGRVGLTPAAAAELARGGHTVMIEAGAGANSGYPNEQYAGAGVQVMDTADELFGEAEMIVKVKEPIEADLDRLREDHLLFCYLHLAALPDLTARLREIGLTVVAFETVEDDGGRLPLLAPMSDIAGRLSMQVATHLLHQPQGGKGLLLGGVPAAPRGKVVIVGGGVAGGNAAVIAAGLGAEVTVFDMDRGKLEAARALGPNVTGLHAHAADIADAVAEADIVVGAVLVTGERAPHVISAEMIRGMQPGSVIVDISVDQGGCVETTHATTYENPTYSWEGVTHFTVSNMPGAVPRTASQALSAAITPYAIRLTQPGWESVASLKKGVNVAGGKVVHPALLK